jgi:hypothetical protein
MTTNRTRAQDVIIRRAVAASHRMGYCHAKGYDASGPTEARQELVGVLTTLGWLTNDIFTELETAYDEGRADALREQEAQ